MRLNPTDRILAVGTRVSVVATLVLGAACADPDDDTVARQMSLQPGCEADGGTAAPTVTLMAPQGGTTVSGVVTLRGRVTGPIANVEVFTAAGKMVGRAAPVGFDVTIAVDTKAIPDGPVTLTAKAWDVPAGQAPTFEVSSAPLALTIANAAAPPPPPAAGPCVVNTANTVDITAFGAVANASTNNHDAIQKAIDAARASGKAVFVPAGTYGYSGTIALDGVDLRGAGATSVLRALDVANESLILRGSGAGVHTIKLTSPATTRLSTPWSGMMWADHATSFDVGCVTVDGSSSVGIIAIGSSNGKVHDSVFKNTQADSIHMTGATHDMQVFHNRIENSGDDGVACVSYNGVSPGNGADSNYVRDVKAWDNVILDNKNGRAMSVVGGKRIEYWNNYLRGGPVGTSCLYLAQEGAYSTWEANGVFVHDNKVVTCGGKVHPASLLVFADDWANRDIRIVNNSFWSNRGGQGSIALQGTNVNVTQSGTTTDVGAVPPPPF